MVRYIKVRFDGFTVSKTYTYKTLLTDNLINKHVVCQTNGTYSVGVVVDEIFTKPEFPLKWAFQLVDKDALLECMKVKYD
jgi:hypothetical protein